MDADSRDDVTFPPGVAGAVGEDHLVVAFARAQQTQVLGEKRQTFLSAPTGLQLFKQA